MEQSLHLSGVRIDARDTRTLVAVAAKARQRQIFRRRRPAVFARQDRVELEAQFREAFGEVSILAPELGAPPHHGFQRGCHFLSVRCALQGQAGLGLEKLPRRADRAIALKFRRLLQR